MSRGISMVASVLVMVLGGALVLYSYVDGKDVYYLIAGIAAMVFAGRAIEKISEDQ